MDSQNIAIFTPLDALDFIRAPCDVTNVLDPRATSSESDIKADGRFTGMYNVTMNIISNTAHCEE